MLRDLEALQEMEVGKSDYFNMFQGGGAFVQRVSQNFYELYEIPLHGGAPDPGYVGTFSADNLPELIRVIYEDLT